MIAIIKQMLSDLSREQVEAGARHVLTAGSAYLVGQGLLNKDQAALLLLYGAPAVVALIWSIRAASLKVQTVRVAEKAPQEVAQKVAETSPEIIAKEALMHAPAETIQQLAESPHVAAVVLNSTLEAQTIPSSSVIGREEARATL